MVFYQCNETQKKARLTLIGQSRRRTDICNRLTDEDFTLIAGRRLFLAAQWR